MPLLLAVVSKRARQGRLISKDEGNSSYAQDENPQVQCQVL